MTNQRIIRLRKKIQESRTRLMSTRPIFALLLMYMRFEAVPGMKKVSTDGITIFFSPKYFENLYWYELDYILCHQIMHIVSGDIWRPSDFKGDDYHFACDILTNHTLQKLGFFDFKFSHLGEIVRSIPGCDMEIDGFSPKEIYTLLPFSLYSLDERTRNRFFSDSDMFWGQNGSVEDGILITEPTEYDSISHYDEMPCGLDLKLLWRKRINVAVGLLKKSYTAGGKTNTDCIERLAKKLSEPTMNWKKILSDFIQEVTCDYSFSPPDRRYEGTGFFLPDFNEKEYRDRDILFMVDTSGSVDDENLSIVFSEIKGAIEQFGGKLKGKLGFFDEEIKTVLPFESVNDILHMVPLGGGGTDFRPIFGYVRSHYYNDLPTCIIIFTDGEGPYPQENDTLKIPVLWVLNNKIIKPPFGKLITIIPDEKRKSHAFKLRNYTQ